MRYSALLIALAFAGCTLHPNNGPDLGGDGDMSPSSGSDMAITGVCQGVKCTGANMVCDPLDGKCKLDGTTTNVGAKCDTSGADPKCGKEPNATCNDQTQDGFPGGYCSVEPCTDKALCPIGSSCAHLNGEAPACFKNCTTDGDCRTPDYNCQEVDGLYTSGGSHKVCFFPKFGCNTKADCPAQTPTCMGATMTMLGTCI